MRYLLTIGFAASLFGLAACSSSDGEDGFFFDRTPALTQLVLDQCQQTPEDLNPLLISNAAFFNANFPAPQASAPENTDPVNTDFTNACVSDTPSP